MLHRSLSIAAALAAALALAACAMPPSKEEQEAAKNTFACQLTGERIVLRFDVDEVRILMPDGGRVVLYQIPSASGVRYSNGSMELRGKGADLQLIRNGILTQLADCQPLAPPK
jgi:membrane-bound inhibitor of C-type lysozyme